MPTACGVALPAAPALADVGDQRLHHVGVRALQVRRDVLPALLVGHATVAREPSLGEDRHDLLRELVVADDLLVRHPDQTEHERGEATGAVLPGDAEEHRGKRVGFEDRLHRRDVRAGTELHHVRVELGRGLAFERRHVGADAVERRAVHVAHRDFAEGPDPHLLDLVARPEVDGGAHADVAEQRRVGGGDGVQRIAPEQAVPAHVLAAGHRVAAEVAEVDGTFEGDAARGHRDEIVGVTGVARSRLPGEHPVARECRRAW